MDSPGGPNPTMDEPGDNGSTNEGVVGNNQTFPRPKKLIPELPGASPNQGPPDQSIGGVPHHQLPSGPPAVAPKRNSSK